MDYEQYSAEDFLADESFQQYCAGTNYEAIVFWSNQLQKQTEIRKTVEEAQSWFKILNTAQGDLQEETERLKHRIHQASKALTGEKQSIEKSKAANVKPFIRTWWAAAAAIIIVLSMIGYVLINNVASGKKDIVKKENLLPYRRDIPPGGDKAILTLADGSTIILDSAANGMLAQQGNVKVLKLENGQLAYQFLPISVSGSAQQTILYNTITTPRGGQYQITLADESKVWLNASSSLRFPNVFAANERIVEIEGEAYFEIKKNTSRPFKVRIHPQPGMPKGTEVEVLGTRFNINAYDDEPFIKTTLLEGSIKLSLPDSRFPTPDSRLLLPGQQAQFDKENRRFFVDKDADLNKAIAWKNGLFDFDNDHLSDIMRQLSRWYDVDVIYPGRIPERHYTGSVRRQVNISQVIRMLELAGGVNCSIEGNPAGGHAGKIVVREK